MENEIRNAKEISRGNGYADEIYVNIKTAMKIRTRNEVI
jgi:hypothetical protein